MISTEHKCIFIHIPRTAGKSISYALGNRSKPAGRHFFARRIKQELGNYDWNSYFKFSFVRNPWDRTVSLYFHQNEADPNDKEGFRVWLKDQVEKNGYPNNNSLKWEARYGDQSSTGGISVPWKCYSDWIIDEDGNNCMDFIGRYESLERDWNTVCGKIGINRKLPVDNKTIHKEYTYYYDDDLKQIVADWFARDIKRFNYTFGSSAAVPMLL